MISKQISLIIPKLQITELPSLFMGIWYVGSYLKQHGFNVRIYDEQLNEASNNLNYILENSILVGFTVMTVQIEDALKLSKIIKRF